MYIRNELAEPRTYHEVNTEQDIDALTVTSYAKWLFKCALQAIDLLDSTDAAPRNFRSYLLTLVSKNPNLIEYEVRAHKDNPKVAAVYLLFDSGVGEFVYSFSAQEFSDASSA